MDGPEPARIGDTGLLASPWLGRRDRDARERPRRLRRRAAFFEGVVVVHDALLFHEAEAFLSSGTRDAKADWVRKAVAERGVYFPAGQSPGQSTTSFVLRFATGGYFRGAGWPAMFDRGLDETPLPVLAGPLARAAEQGFVTAFFGNNFMLLPTQASVAWDVGMQSELRDQPLAMLRAVERWAHERPHDDAVIVWWNAETHAPHGAGRTGSPAPAPMLDAWDALQPRSRSDELSPPGRSQRRRRPW